MLHLDVIKGDLARKVNESRMVTQIKLWVKSVSDIKHETSATRVILHSGIRCHDDMLNAPGLKLIKNLSIIDGEICLYYGE